LSRQIITAVADVEIAIENMTKMFTQNRIRISLGVQNANNVLSTIAEAKDTDNSMMTRPTGRERHGEKEYTMGSEQEAIVARTKQARSQALSVSKSRVIVNILLSS
jgi:hypothetical protein